MQNDRTGDIKWKILQMILNSEHSATLRGNIFNWGNNTPLTISVAPNFSLWVRCCGRSLINCFGGKFAQWLMRQMNQVKNISIAPLDCHCRSFYVWWDKPRIIILIAFTLVVTLCCLSQNDCKSSQKCYSKWRFAIIRRHSTQFALAE